MERKDFIKKFAIGGSILFSAPLLFDSCSKDDGTGDNNNGGNPSNEIVIDLNNADFSALGSVGGYAYKDNIIIFRTSETGYSALSKICTHQGCTVIYNHSDDELPCPCHGSIYSATGTVLNGPATASLKRYNVKKDGNTLIIT
jgi:cytochrome b6-f complex iron-sulfur subunit